MNKEIISSKQGASMLIMFTIGSAIVLAPWKISGNDGWIAILTALVMMVPMIIIYSRLVLVFPGYDFFDLQIKVFGSFIGKIILLIYIFYSVHLGTMIFRNFSEFIGVFNLPNTPLLFIAIINGILCIWIVKSGIEVIGRWAEFFLPIFIILFGILSLLLAPKMDLNNLRPVLYNGIGPVLTGAAATFCFPYAETFLFTTVFNSLKVKKQVYKIYTISLVLVGVLLALTFARNVSVLGDKLDSYLYFPTYTVVSLINVRDFIDRIEVLVAINLFFLVFVKESIVLYAASVGFARVFNIKDYRQIVAPIGLIMVLLSIYVYSSTMEMFEFAVEVYNYYVLPFAVVLPIITLIFSEIKARSQKNKNKS